MFIGGIGGCRVRGNKNQELYTRPGESETEAQAGSFSMLKASVLNPESKRLRAAASSARLRCEASAIARDLGQGPARCRRSVTAEPTEHRHVHVCLGMYACTYVRIFLCIYLYSCSLVNGTKKTQRKLRTGA